MRIAFLSHSAASIYHFRMPIIKALEARKDEVFVLVPQDEYTQKLKELGLKVIVYKFQRSSLNPFVILQNFFSLTKVLRALNLDLLQSAAHKSNTFGIFAAKWVKIPHRFALVEGLGSFYIEENFKAILLRFIINTLYKISFKLAHQFIFVNQSNADFMHSLGLKEHKICVIKSVGIDLKRFFPVFIEKREKQVFWKAFKLDEKPVVLMIARALWHKGVKEFYESAKLLEDKANFVLVGSRDDNISCASLEFLSSAKVHYLGPKDNIAELLQNCDIFVLPSYKEGFPMSVLEAKACAKAIVVSDCEGCVEAITHAYDGLWAKTKDSKDLAKKIMLLLENENLRLILGKNAAKEALSYDQNIIAQRYLALYDKKIKNV